MKIDKVKVGRVFGSKAELEAELGHRFVRVDRIFDGADGTPSVAFVIMINGLRYEDRWKTFSVLSRELFEEKYVYLPQAGENASGELEDATTLREQLQTDIGVALGAVGVKTPDGVAELFVRLVRHEAAREILAHPDFNEGCAGIGCCADGPDEAAELIDAEITAKEIEALSE
jgi:hypothetical protein